jgi:hypothetical protein
MADNVRILYNDSDNLIQVNNVTDQKLGTAITGAEVNVTVYDRDGTEVSGPTWPVLLDEDGGGDYSGILPDTMVLLPPDFVDVEVDINGGADLQRTKMFRNVRVKEA